MKEWVSDWSSNDILDRHLENIANKQRAPVVKGHYDVGKGPVTPQEKLNSLMFSGIDYKGQAQHLFDTTGYGAGVNASLDLAKMFVPPPASLFVTASVSGNVGVKKAQQRFIFVSHHGNRDEFLTAPSTAENLPIALCKMEGSWKNVKAGIAVTAGAKFDTSSITPITISDVEAFNFGISLTAKAEANCEGVWVAVTDPDPWFIPKEGAMHNLSEWFNAVMPHQKTDTSLSVNHSCYLTWFVQGKDAGLGLDAKATATTAFSAGKINGDTAGPGGTFTFAAKLPSIKWTSKTSSYRINLPTQVTAVNMSQESRIVYKQTGGQLLSLALDFEIGPATIKNGNPKLVDPQSFAPGLSQKINPDSGLAQSRIFDNPNAKASSASVSETVGPNDLELYKSENFKATLTSKSLKVGLFEDKFKKIEKKWETVNSMGYEMGIAYWSPGKTNSSKTNLLEGSGLILGQSLTLASLIKVWANREQCEAYLGQRLGLPDVQTILQKTKELVTQEEGHNRGLRVPSQMPSYDNWYASTETGEWRRKISPADDAVKAFWKHIEKNNWADPSATLQRLSKAAGTDAVATRKFVGTALDELKTRGILYTNILAALNGWIAARGSQLDAERNGRWPGVYSMGKICEEYLLQADLIASQIDVLYEALESHQIRDGLKTSLQIKEVELNALLEDQHFKEIVMDLVGKDKKEVPGAFLIEAAHKLKSPQIVSVAFRPETSRGDIQDSYTDIIQKADKQLQSVSVRYRKVDTLSSDRSFKLGVNLGAATFGFSLDRVLQAGNEGSFMICTKWFNDYQEYNAASGWPKKTVPMPIILS